MLGAGTVTQHWYSISSGEALGVLDQVREPIGSLEVDGHMSYQIRDIDHSG
jgi:hypothetical protein